MKRISFLILVFILTTGFFKSALEECADIQMKLEKRFMQIGEFKNVEMTDGEKLIARKKWEKVKKKYESTKKNEQLNIRFFIEYGSLEYQPTHKKVKIKILIINFTINKIM